MKVPHWLQKLYTPIKWPKRLVVVRHGLSEQNFAFELSDDLEALAQQKEIRDADVELTDIGAEQARQTGAYLSTTEKFDICISSPYKRTVQTAHQILENIGYEMRHIHDVRLREKEFGRLHGYTGEEILREFPNEFRDYHREGKFYYRPPRGENYPDVELRLRSFFTKLSGHYAGKNVLVVTHQIPYKLFRRLFEHLDEKKFLKLEDIPNCGIEEFLINRDKYPEGRMRLSYYNKIAYDKNLLLQKK